MMDPRSRLAALSMRMSRRIALLLFVSVVAMAFSSLAFSSLALASAPPESNEFEFHPSNPNNPYSGPSVVDNLQQSRQSEPSFIHNLQRHISHITRHLEHITRNLKTSDTCSTHSSFTCLTDQCPSGTTQVSDCSKCDGYLFGDSRHGICYDRKLFHTSQHVLGSPDDHYPFLWNDLLGTIVWFLTAGIATACGVGGGGIYVPMGILLLRFPPKPSSGLSQASIFGASLGGLMVNSRNRHPEQHIRDVRGIPLRHEGQNGEEVGEEGKIVSWEKDMTTKEIEASRQAYLSGGDGQRKFYTRPVINYDMALFLAPMEMAGAVLGVIIQRLFPNWLFLSFAVIILGFTSYKTYVKFFASYAKDKKIREERRLREQRESTMSSSMMDSIKDESKRVSLVSASATADVESNDSDGNMNEGAAVFNGSNPEDGEEQFDDPKSLTLRRHFLARDSRQFPVEKILALCLLWAGLTIITFLKGGKGVNSIIGITCEDAAYYVLVAAQFVWTMGFAGVFALKGIKMTKERLEVGYPFLETDVLWNFKRVQYYAFYTFIAGVVAGLIGIGGGMILGPLMLVMGVHPSVSTATTATMIVLTSSSVAVMFVMSGQVPWEYAVYFFLVCYFGAILGKLKIDAYVRRTGMASVLIGTLATIIGLATLGCLVIMLMNLAEVNWCLAGFNSFCSVGKEVLECVEGRLLSEAEMMFPY